MLFLSGGNILMNSKKCYYECMERKVEDISCIKGLKGAGCIMVVLIHFCAAFFPCLYSGNIALKKFPFESLINHSPLYIIYNGSFAVYIFWTISAFLIMVHWLHDNDISSMAQTIIKKYVRFLGPVFIVCLLTYLLMEKNLFFNIIVSEITGSDWLAMFFNQKPDIGSFLKCVFWDTYFSGSILLYDPVLWSMKVEFLGSVFTVCFLALYGNIRRRNALLFLLTIFFLLVNPQYICFIIGILCGDIWYRNKYGIEKKWLFFLCLIGMIGGGIRRGIIRKKVCMHGYQ